MLLVFKSGKLPLCLVGPNTSMLGNVCLGEDCGLVFMIIIKNWQTKMVFELNRVIVSRETDYRTDF